MEHAMTFFLWAFIGIGGFLALCLLLMGLVVAYEMWSDD